MNRIENKKELLCRPSSPLPRPSWTRVPCLETQRYIIRWWPKAIRPKICKWSMVVTTRALKTMRKWINSPISNRNSFRVRTLTTVFSQLYSPNSLHPHIVKKERVKIQQCLTLVTAFPWIQLCLWMIHPPSVLLRWDITKNNPKWIWSTIPR